MLPKLHLSYLLGWNTIVAVVSYWPTSDIICFEFSLYFSFLILFYTQALCSIYTWRIENWGSIKIWEKQRGRTDIAYQLIRFHFCITTTIFEVSLHDLLWIIFQISTLVTSFTQGFVTRKLFSYCMRIV